MLTFAYPWMLVILPLPWVVWKFFPPLYQRRAAVRVPFFERLVSATGQTPGRGAAVSRRTAGNIVVLIVAWLFAVLALTRPQWLKPPIVREMPTRDLLLLVDLSVSMETKDFTNAKGEQVDRLTAVKEVVGDFLVRRRGDRVGLVVFGNAAFMQVPFTTDLDLSRQLLDETAVGMAGPKTAFGDAIGLGITLFDRSEMQSKTIIALTDGNDTGSQVPPGEAAAIAKDKGIVIHTVAIGDPAAVGEEKLDSKALEDVARKTGGGSFHAEDREGLEAIYKRLDELETRKVETVTHRPRLDLYHWIAGAIFLLTLGAASLPLLRRNRHPIADSPEPATERTRA